MSRALRDGRLGVAIVLAALVAVTIVLTVRWLDEPRPFAGAIAQPAPLDTTPVVALRPGKRVCISHFTLTPHSEVASFRVGTRFKPGVPLAWDVTGDGGYRQEGLIGAGWEDNALLTARIDPPDEPVRAEMCFANQGRWPVDFYAAEGRSGTPAETVVEGGGLGPNIQLRFDEAAPATVSDRRGEIAREVTVFRSPVIGRWLVWALALLVVLGVPLALGLAVWRGAAEDAQDAADTASRSPAST